MSDIVSEAWARFVSWEKTMESACNLRCQYPGRLSCDCPACATQQWFESLMDRERVALFLGMSDAGFMWPMPADDEPKDKET